VAELTDRPFPPGSYPVIVVGSGPGGLQVSYSLSRYGIDHAVLSADEAPGGMFRRWPFFQRLLSWTKPYAPVPHDHPAYQRYDWNSLLADEPEHQALMPGLMDGASYFPSRPEMQQNLETFASRTGIAMHRQPMTYSSSSVAYPSARILASVAMSSSCSTMVLGVKRGS